MPRLIIDIATNRVTYFTTDMEQTFTLNEHVTMRDWLEDTPSDMKLNNCWNWRIEGDKLVNTEINNNPPPLTLFQQNRNKVRNLLVEKINDARRPYFSKAVGGDYIRDRKLKEAQEGNGPMVEQLANDQGKDIATVCSEIIAAYRKFAYVMARTEELKLKYQKAINEATQDSQLWAIRDEFANTNLTA
jgi:hypothetical protein